MAYNAKISQQRGSHFLKAGSSTGADTASPSSEILRISISPTELTAETFIESRRRSTTASGFATFLLGALDGSSQMIGGPAPDPHVKFWGMFFQDDWKVKRWLTINMGIRNEYEIALVRPESQHVAGSRPEPADSRDAGESAEDAGAGDRAHGQRLLQVERHVAVDQRQPSRACGMPQKLALAPRLGAAIKINETTALRIGLRPIPALRTK